MSQLRDTLKVLLMKVSRSARTPLESASERIVVPAEGIAYGEAQPGREGVAGRVPVNDGKKFVCCSSAAESYEKARLVDREPRVFGKFNRRSKPTAAVVRKLSVRSVSVRKKLSVHCS